MNSKESATVFLRNHGIENVQRIARSGNELSRAMAITVLEIAEVPTNG